MTDYLVTESDDQLITEHGDAFVADGYVTCAWPTLDEVKIELGILVPDDDSFLQRQINTTVNSIEKYLGRRIPGQVDREVFRITQCDLTIV